MTQTTTSFRQKELAARYLQLLDRHLQDLKEGRAERTLEVRDFAAMLHVHPVHLSNTIKEVTGQSTCDLYEERMVNLAKELLAGTSLGIGQIALHLTYDPSNFTKFFKQYTGLTPKQFRNSRPCP